MFELSDSRNVILFTEELKKQVQKLASQYGLHVSDFPVVETESGVYVNLTAYKKNPNDVFADFYIKKAVDIGLDISWLGVSFFVPESKMKLKIIGLDPDGGDWCVLLKNEEGKNFHMLPAAVSHLVVNQINK